MSSPEQTMHCPTDETLAAFIDGRLQGAERQRVEEHLASCSECYATWQSVAEFRDAEVPGNVVRGRFGRWWIYAAASAAAAAIVVVLFLGPIREQFSGPGEETLIAAMKGVRTRPFEPRLSADFPYKPWSPKRGAGDEADDHPPGELDLELAALRIKEESDDPRARGAALLFLGERDAAVETLEKALTDGAIAKTNDADLLNDLAAAYLVRASYKNGGGDREAAFKAADRAWRLDPKPATAFNRALAIEAFRSPEESKKAWVEYLEFDPTSLWAADARKHLRRLSAE